MFTGIVQAIGSVVHVTSSGVEVGVPAGVARSLEVGGSIAVKGIRLTPFGVCERSFRCAMISELREQRPDELVSHRFDILAKHAERMMRYVRVD